MTNTSNRRCPWPIVPIALGALLGFAGCKKAPASATARPASDPRQTVRELNRAAQDANQRYEDAVSKRTEVENELRLAQSSVTNLGAQLKVASGRIDELESRLTDTSNRLEGFQSLLRQAAQLPALPPPAIQVVNGKKIYTFPKLLSSAGGEIGRDAQFQNALRRRLTFKFLANDRYAAFDLGELHPEILTTLGIDVTAANEAEKKYRDQMAVYERWRAQEAVRLKREAEAQAERERQRQADLAREQEEARSRTPATPGGR